MTNVIDQLTQSKVIGDRSINKNTRKIHLSYAIELAELDGYVLEFGVYKGKTLKHMCKTFSKKQPIYGFDSFEGLPEPWYTTTDQTLETVAHPKGYFSGVSVEQLKFKDNVKLIKGFFDTSLPEWLQEHTDFVIKLLHIDCDLYSSTKTVFEYLNDFIVPGTIIVFDEMYPWGGAEYDLWHEGEYKALVEWLDMYNREFTAISRNHYQQCAIKITK